MDVIDMDEFTFGSIQAWLLANGIPPKDAVRAPGGLRYDGEARVIRWTRFLRTGDGRYTFDVRGNVATESTVTPVKDGQEPQHYLIANLSCNTPA